MRLKIEINVLVQPDRVIVIGSHENASRVTLTATMAQMYGKEKDSEKDTTGSILLVMQVIHLQIHWQITSQILVSCHFLMHCQKNPQRLERFVSSFAQRLGVTRSMLLMDLMHCSWLNMCSTLTVSSNTWGLVGLPLDFLALL